MEEFSLGNVLQGLREKFSRGIVQKEKIATVISSTLDYTVAIHDFSIKGKTLYITLPPVLKHELYIKKEALLELLKKENIFFDDIR